MKQGIRDEHLNQNNNPSAASVSAAIEDHRPMFQLRSLPVEHRWEVTRRHAYYQIYWPYATAYHDGTPPTEAFDNEMQCAAAAMLRLIGISGRPIDPATSFTEISKGLKPAWLSGVVHPISLRGLIGLVVVGLPEATLLDLGNLLLSLGDAPSEELLRGKLRVTEGLLKLDAPELDCYPDEPIVSINPAASERQLAVALCDLLGEWKSERNLTERRNRPEKFAEYMQVWDIREGWADGRYERDRERTLKSVAEELKEPISTVYNRYCSAFQLITGRAYTPELWLRIFGALKLVELTDQVTRNRLRRQTKSRTPRPVPDSVLAPRDKSGDGRGLTENVSTQDDCATRELLFDIATLIDKGRSDGEIVAELELEDSAIDAAVIAHLRERGELLEWAKK
jgi:hypothetical protein